MNNASGERILELMDLQEAVSHHIQLFKQAGSSSIYKVFSFFIIIIGADFKMHTVQQRGTK